MSRQTTELVGKMYQYLVGKDLIVPGKGVTISDGPSISIQMWDIPTEPTLGI